MARLRLRKLLRGEAGAALRAVIALAPDPLAIRDGAGRLLLGDDPGPDAPGIPISIDGEHLGEVVGGATAPAVAQILSHLGARELEKLQLAHETLGRYKELTLLYDMSDRLSHMLEAGEVAQTVVDEAQRAVGGTRCALYMHDQRSSALVALARSSDDEPTLLPAGSGLEGRVLRTGQAEFIETVDTETRITLDASITSLICAPIRAGDRVVGVLRVAHSKPAAWTSGDLKLITSLAAQAAAALQGVELHAGRLREVALKHQLQRYVSPHLLAATTGTHTGGSIAVLFCDLAVTHDTSDSPEALVSRMERRLTSAVSLLLAAGAVVDVPQGEMVLAAFHRPTRREAATAAAAAATTLVAALTASRPERAALGAGVAACADPLAQDALGEAISAAALLQSASLGRVLVDGSIADALPSGSCLPAEVDVVLPGSRPNIYEVRP